MVIFTLVSFVAHPIRFLREWRESKDDQKNPIRISREYAQQPVAHRIKPRIRPGDQLPEPPSDPRSKV